MKIRKIIAALVAGLLIACCVMIYLMLDVTLFPLGHEFKNSVKDVRIFTLFQIYFLIISKYLKNS